MKIIDVAKICHEANKALCESILDNSQPTWDEAPTGAFRASAINGVKFHLANPFAGAEDSHENWLKVKKADGWAYGPVKDPEKKLHPCFVPYHELPKSQQAKDYLFKGIVDSLRAFIDADG